MLQREEEKDEENEEVEKMSMTSLTLPNTLAVADSKNDKDKVASSDDEGGNMDAGTKKNYSVDFRQ